MYDFILPDVGEGLHEAELVEWNVAVGDTVAEGDVVAVVNTDKVSVDLPSPVSGTVTSLPWDVGDTLLVGQVLMSFATDGASAVSGGPAPQPATRSAPSTAPAMTGAGTESSAAAPTPDLPPPPPTAAAAVSAALGRPIAAPSTRKLAAELGVDLTQIAGTGPGGRILRADVEARSSGAPSAAGAAGAAPLADEVVREPLTGVRGTVWRHMQESSGMAATTTSTFTVRAEGIEALLAELSAGDDGAQERPKVGVLAATAACVVRALTRHPRFNATVDPDTNELLVHRAVQLGVAVAAPTGLMVPVIPHADQLRLEALSEAIADRARRARNGELGVADLRGGTFTVSSTGGIERGRVTSTQPILNLPQVALLWMSRIRDEPVVDDGAVVAGRVMACSLSFDHRYLDGAEATMFINELTELIEHPIRALA